MLSQLAAQVHHAEDEVGVFGGFVGIFPLIQPGLSYSPTIPDIYDTWCVKYRKIPHDHQATGFLKTAHLKFGIDFQPERSSVASRLVGILPSGKHGHSEGIMQWIEGKI